MGSLVCEKSGPKLTDIDKENIEEMMRLTAAA